MEAKLRNENGTVVCERCTLARNPYSRMRGLLEQHIASASSNRTVAKITEKVTEPTEASVPAKTTPPEPRNAREDAPVTVASIAPDKPEAASPAPAAGQSPAPPG